MRQLYLPKNIEHKYDEQRSGQIVSYETINGIGEVFDESTVLLFGALQKAYNYFKRELFNNELPPVVLTLNRKVRSMGYYMPFAWLKNESQEIIPEININPDILELPTIEVMQTLVHETCHHFQQFFGSPGKRGYHNKEFSRIMFSKGLMCSSTGLQGGKVTGRRMADYVIDGGPFSIKFKAMPEEFMLPFISTQKISANPSIQDSSITNVLKTRNKTKYSCPKCEDNVWGKPNMELLCINCNKIFKQN